MIKKTLKYFAISFLIILLCLLGQFLFKYYEDLFFKGFGTSAILQLCFYTSLTLLPTTLIMSAGITSALVVRRSYQIKKEFILKKHIHKVFISAIIFGLLLFLYSNYIVPGDNIKFSALLYDMRHTQSGEEINRSDIALFEDNFTCKSISEINEIMVFKHTEYNNIVHKMDSIYNCLPNDNRKLNSKELANVLHIKSLKRQAEYDIRMLKTYKEEIYRRYVISVVLFLIILTGVFIGYLLRNKRDYIHIIVMTIVGILYYLSLMLFGD